MTPESLRKEIKEKVTAAVATMPPDPKANLEQKAERAELTRRIAAGEPVPWDELYRDLRRVGQPARRPRRARCRAARA